MNLQPFTLLACLSLPLAGCILVADDDDFDDDMGLQTDGEFDSSAEGGDAFDPATGDSGGLAETGTDGSTGGDTNVDDDLECGENLLADPGFETGTPNEMWEEASELFGTPLCDDTCTSDPGAAPYAGDWWIWFGGMEEAEYASVVQTATFDADTALLSFQFSINAAAGTGDDIFAVRIDEETVFMVTDAEWEDYEDYTLVELDVSDFADGEEHRITFEADLTGGGLTNFFVDEVSLLECSAFVDEGSTGAGESGSTGTGGLETGTDTGAMGTSTGAGESGESGESGGSDESGSTGA